MKPWFRCAPVMLALCVVLLLILFTGVSPAGGSPAISAISYAWNAHSPDSFLMMYDGRIDFQISGNVVEIDATASGPQGEQAHTVRARGLWVELRWPELASSGAWTLTRVVVKDDSGAVREYTAGDLRALGLDPEFPVRRFTDVTVSHPQFTQIDYLAARNIIGGYTDLSFGADDSVKRQQFAKMIVKTLSLPVSMNDQCSFSDVTSGAGGADPLYPDKYVAACAKNGITLGTSPTTFAPYNNITRAQLITMVARAATLASPPPGFSPAFGDFSPTHYPWARKAAYAGLLEALPGMGAGYSFFQPATRAEVCVILHNLLHRQ